MILMMSFFTGCYYDVEEELYPQGSGDCDTLNITYSQHVSLIMSSSCNDCHNSSAPSAGIITDNYDDLKVIADNGDLWGAVNHEPDYSPMPKDRPKLNDCDLKQIRIWLDEGALQN